MKTKKNSKSRKNNEENLFSGNKGLNVDYPTASENPYLTNTLFAVGVPLHLRQSVKHIQDAVNILGHLDGKQYSKSIKQLNTAIRTITTVNNGLSNSLNKLASTNIKAVAKPVIAEGVPYYETTVILRR